MEPYATPLPQPAPAQAWESYPLISPTRFLVLCILSLGLYGVWWQYKTWRFFKHWRHNDTWPAMRAIFSLFTIHGLLQSINEFAYATGEDTPLPNPTVLAAGYIVLNLMGRLPDPFSIVALGASGFLVPAYAAFRAAMLQAPGYGGSDQPGFNTRQWLIVGLGGLLWGLVVAGMLMPA